MIPREKLREAIERTIKQIEPKGRKLTQEKPSVVRIDSGEVVGHIENSIKTLKELYEKEAKNMIEDFGREVGFGVESILRSFCEFLAKPEAGFQFEKVENGYGQIRSSFLEKYTSFFGSPHEKPELIFCPINEIIEEIKKESKRIEGLLKTPEAQEKQEPTQQVSKEPSNSTLEKKQEKETTSLSKGSSSIFGSLLSVVNKFKPNGSDGYTKTNLGKDSSGMKWDPVKKKWMFDDDPEEVITEDVKKLPPKKDASKPKEAGNGDHSNTKQPEQMKETTITDALIKPRARNIGGARGKDKNGPPGEKPAPKIQKITPRTFEGINSISSTFSFEQQRELIIFTLKELVISSLNQSKTTQQQEKSYQDNKILLESDELNISTTQLDSYRSSIVLLVEENLIFSLQRTIKLWKSLMEKQPLLEKKVPEMDSKEIQTINYVDEDIQSKLDRQAVEIEKNKSYKKFYLDDNKTQIKEIEYQNKQNSELDQLISKDLHAISELHKLVNELQEHAVSKEDLEKLVSSITGFVGTSLKYKKTNSVVSVVVKCVEMLIKENNRKGNYIIELQKKFKERKAKSYEMMKQNEVVQKEKEMLKFIAKNFMEESAYYQKECEILCAEYTKLLQSYDEVSSQAEMTNAFYTKVVKGLKDKLVGNQETYEKIFTEFKKAYMKEKEKCENLENFIYNKSEMVKKDKMRVETAFENIQNDFERVCKRANDLEKALLEKEIRKNECINEVELVLRRELENKNKLDSTKEELHKIEKKLQEVESVLSKCELQKEFYAQELEKVSATFEEFREKSNQSVSEVSEISQRYEEALKLSEEVHRELGSLKDNLKEKELLLYQATVEIREKEDEIERYTQKTNEAESTIHGLENEIERLTALNSSNRTDLEAYESQWSQFWEYLQSQNLYKDDTAAEGSIVTSIEEVISKFREDSETLQAQLRELEEEIQSLKRQNSDLLRDSSRDEELQNCKMSLAKMESREVELLTSIENKEKIYLEKEEALKSQIEDLEFKQSEAERIISDKMDEIGTIASQLSVSQAESQVAQDRVSEVLRDMERLEMNLKQREEVVTNQAGKIEEMKRSMDESLKRISAGDEGLAKEIESLVNQLEGKDQAIEDVERRLREEEEKQYGFIETLKAKELEINRLKQEINGLREEITGSKEEVESSRNTIVILEKKLEDFKKEKQESEIMEIPRRRKSSIGEDEKNEVFVRLEEHEKRVQLLQMDIKEANKTIEEFKQEREELKKKVFTELNTSAESGNKEATDLINTLFKDFK